MNYAGSKKFETTSSGVSIGGTTIITPASGGKLGIGTNIPLSGTHISDGAAYGSPQNASRKATLTISAGSEASADIQLLSANYNHIFFGDSADPNTGMIHYEHTGSNVDSLVFSTAGSERLRIYSDGDAKFSSKLGVGVEPVEYLDIRTTGSATALVGSTNASGAYFKLDGDSNGDGSGGDYARLVHDTDGRFYIDNLKSTADIVFRNGASATERLRIDSSGRLLVGTNTNNAHANADNAVISGTGNIGLSIMSTDSGRSSIYFGDSSSSPGSYAGFIDFVHSSNSFNIGRGNDNSLTIDSSGRLGLNQSTPASRLHISEAGSNTITIQLTNATTGHTAGTDGMTMGYSTNSTAGFINVCESGSHFTIKTGGTGSANERLRITSDGRLLIGETSVAGSAKLVVGNGGAENFEFTSGNSTYNGGLIEYIHRGDGNSRPDMNMYVAGPGAFKVYTNGANERVRITSNGDFKLSASTALSSPNTGYKRIVIGNNLILNAGSSAGGYTGFQNNAYVNSSGNWVRVNNDYASSIGMDDGNIYFRNVGAGTGNISWSMPLQIYANGTSTFGSTVTVNGHILSQGTSGRGGIFGQIQVGYSTLYNSIQNSVANTPIHLQYNNTGDIKCNEGGGDLRTNDVIPHTNNSANLGSNTRRWANVHTNDLNLSNEGNSNEIDGTWGQYTIQEGESDLFLINRRSGKRYKFLLQEV